MRKEDYQKVGICVQEMFMRRTKGKKNSAEDFPAVLSVLVELIDLHNAEENTKECKQVVVQCDERESSKYKLRSFYQYNDEASYITRPAKELPDRLRITNVKSQNRTGMHRTTEGERLISFLVEGDWAIRHYEKWQWDKCFWPHESYVNILAGLFFFCPKILWCAISTEIKERKEDIYVVQAIKKCLDLYVLLDEIEKLRREDPCYYDDEAIRRVTRSHLIDEIADVVVEQDKPKTRIEHVGDMAVSGISFIVGMSVGKSFKKSLAIKVLGWKNYRYLRKRIKRYY